MTNKIFFSILALIFIGPIVFAQKPKTKTTITAQSNAEKMGYERTNKYWGPGTFYCYAPGKPLNKLADNALSKMRDLTGISREDFYTEIAKQAFVEVPQTKKKTWYKKFKGLGEHYYSSDKSYILEPNFEDLYMSPVKEDGKYAYASKTVVWWALIPIKDSVKVVEAIWQFVRDVRELNALLGTFGSNFKKADPKAYPMQRIMSGGWTGIRAGSWVLTNVNGKLQGHWCNNEEILRRTMGMPEFHFVTEGWEPDFYYNLMVDLTDDGYILRYQVNAQTLTNLPSGVTWKVEYPRTVLPYNNGIKADKDAVGIYKKAPFPPVLEDLDKIMHINK
ncbi:MAG: hypothetical protein JXA16_02345 [Bacteroidales bacterium]|nr:hypothetical protein [Bacteroidales bacterium]